MLTGLTNIGYFGSPRKTLFLSNSASFRVALGVWVSIYYQNLLNAEIVSWEIYDQNLLNDKIVSWEIYSQSLLNETIVSWEIYPQNQLNEKIVLWEIYSQNILMIQKSRGKYILKSC